MSPPGRPEGESGSAPHAGPKVTARPRRQPAQRLGLQGSVWLAQGSSKLGGPERMALLRAVAQQGSITHAAKAVGLSYKGAWDAIDAMNTLAGAPLVERSTGGRGGGATRLTPHGLALVERYEQIAAVHQRFLQLLDAQAVDLTQHFSLLKVVNMKTSARNQFVGTVSAVRAGAVNDEVELTLPGGARLVAVVTRDSTEALGLRTSMTAMALVKSSSVLVATELEGARLSARNQLPGVVSALTPGAVNAEVELAIDGGGSIVATVTQASVKSLGLAVGVRALAFFKASSVILAVVA